MRLSLAFAALLFSTAAAHAADPEAFAHAERKCLAEALYFEAGTEGIAGMAAVAEVVFRRVASPDFPNTVCKVVYQGVAQRRCHFSFACDGARRRPRGRVLWQDSWRLAGSYLADRDGVLRTNATKDATHFHTLDVHPGWEIYGLVETVRIGNHVFYRPETTPPAPPAAPETPAEPGTAP